MCANCDNSCQGCTGPNASECLDCRPNFNLKKSSIGSATGTCECPLASGFFQAGATCSRCHESCTTCTGSQAYQCSTCKTGYLEIKNSAGVLVKCSQGCPLLDQWYDTISTSCKSCNTECTSCEGPANDNCLSCPTGKKLHQKKCLGDCPDGFASVDGQSCVQCTDSKCTKCSATNPGTCLACSVGFAPINGACSNTCPEGKVLVFNDSVCNKCPTGCRTCTLANNLPYLPENLVCTSCTTESDILDEGKCLNDCPSGSQKIQIGNRFSCQTVSCSPLCDRCQSVTKCLRCHTLDPSDSSTGIIQTFDGQCLRCDAKNGLTTKFNASFTAP